MNLQVKVSVIIPVYNVERYLRECIDSVLGQSHENLEVLLVDDGSTDLSGSICDEYAAADARVSVIHKPNGGLSDARNTALDIASGEWIMFVDSDDAISENAVELLLTAAIESKSEISAGCLACVDSIGNLGQVHTLPHTTVGGHDACEKVLYQTCEKQGLIVSACGKLFTKRLFGDKRFTSGILYEDLDLIPRILASANRVAFQSTKIYYYRNNSESILGRFNPRRFDVLDVCDRLVAYFANDERLHRAAADRRMSAAFNMLMLMARHDYADAAVALRCRRIIRRQRFYSLFNPKVRFRNKAGIFLSYLFGIGLFSNRHIANRFLKR